MVQRELVPNEARVCTFVVCRQRIYMNLPKFHFTSDPDRPMHVAGVNGCIETICGVVRHGNCLVFVFRKVDRNRRSEALYVE